MGYEVIAISVKTGKETALTDATLTKREAQTIVSKLTPHKLRKIIIREVKRNPTTRTQRAAESYVRRPSQITKKAPSKRLKKRRTINLQTPRGVFPNPKTRSSLEKTSRWVIRNKKTGEVIMETFDIKKVNALNTAKYEAVPILKYLQELNSGIKKNPSSVHCDIDVNSHNARGAKAKTRTNPAPKKATKYFIATDHKEGVLYFDGVGFSKLKSSAVDFRNEENVTKRAIQLADHFRRAMKVLAE